MTTIGFISDTHGFLDETVFEYFKNCDEIWHAGDIGSLEIIKKLNEFKPCRCVFGNIDDQEIQWEVPENQFFELEGLRFFMTHILGKPLVYSKRTLTIIKDYKPDVVLFGHSHIVTVTKDKKHNLVLLNPGAAGKQGFHKERTLFRITIDNKKIINLELIKLGVR